MPTILVKSFLLFNLLNTAIIYLIPKKLITYLLHSLYSQHTHTTNNSKITSTPPPSPRRLASGVLRRMDSGDLRRVFQIFDRNEDGKITKKELNDSLEDLGIFIPDVDLAQMIDRIDDNGDGCVDMNEFRALYNSIMNGYDEEEEMREAFNVFDKNGDGFIAAEELESVMAALGLKQGMGVEDFRMMITKVDGDGDGMVNFDEFRQMMRGGVGVAALT